METNLADGRFDPPGGSFLLYEQAPAGGLIPEDLDSEARLLAEAASDFMRGEVLPVVGRLEQQEPGLMGSLLRQAGGLGLLGLEIPEQYSGLGLRKSVSAHIAEAVSVEPSFAVSHNVHTSVGTLPTLFFGTPDQKETVLPLLASGEWIGAYALSEAHAGSDAMAARTKAVRTSGGYSLSGEKMWITNAAFADLFTVFARVEGGDGLSAFLVEADRPGMTVGREEHKIGLKGSSTCRLVLDGVEIPAGNRLSEEGEGGRIALNTLNLGRFKIAASSVGRSKDLLGISARYAVERKAFGRPIAEFGLVSAKLASMAARIFAAESMLYRLAGCLERAFDRVDAADPASYRMAAEEYAPECALLKVFCTETLDFCADECVQIHGGYGYTEEFPAGRAWRDARVNRIYEGTSEINRFNVAQLLARRARSGRLDLSGGETEESGALELLMSANPPDQAPQEALGAMADLATELYARQSISARLPRIPKAQSARAEAAASVYSFGSEVRSWTAARLVCVASGNEGRTIWIGMKDLYGSLLPDTCSVYHELGRIVSDAGGYPF